VVRVLRRFLLFSAGFVVVLLGLAVYLIAFWPLRVLHPLQKPVQNLLAIKSVRIYPSPEQAVIENGTVLVRDGIIAAVGTNVDVPPNAPVISCEGCTVTAGFWNTHVHFTERKWTGAEWTKAQVLEQQMQDMLTSRGFTTVVDTGSNLRNTVPLRRRIENGELRGPKIYTAGGGQYPPNGIPFYLRESMPRWLLFFLDTPGTPEQAAAVEESNIRNGADLLKLFTGSYVERGTVLPMPVANAKAAVEVAHRHGQVAFAHESNLAGLQVAVDSGVDVLAHAADTTEGVTDAVLQNAVRRNVGMVPTLKMFATTVTTSDRYLLPIYEEVRSFHQLGGQLLFGTDVGYMIDYDTRDEFLALQKSGLSGADILATLTTNPARRFRVEKSFGTVEVGKSADLTIVEGDPMQNPASFAQVLAAIRRGQVLWTSDKASVTKGLKPVSPEKRI
jgi:imidazolonepropionase-like amidohydrolase